MNELVIDSLAKLLRADLESAPLRAEIVSLGLFAGTTPGEPLDIATCESLVKLLAAKHAGLALELATALFVIGPHADETARSSLEEGAFLACVDARGTTRAIDVEVVGMRDGRIGARTIGVPRHVSLGLDPLVTFREALALERGTLHAISSVAHGVAVAAYEAARTYAEERKQFGRPLATLGAVAEKLARGAERLGSIAPSDEALSAIRVTSAAVEIAHDALQTHGGYGYTRDYPVERLYRDALELHRAVGATDVPVPSVGALSATRASVDG